MSKIQHPLADVYSTKHQPNPLLRFAIAFSSGILMGLATAPLNIYPLAWVALAPLWVLVFGNRQWAAGNGLAAGDAGTRRHRNTETPNTQPSAVSHQQLAIKTQNSKLKTQNSKLKTQPLSSPIALAFAWGIGYHGLALSWIMGLHPLTWMGIPWLGSVAIALFCWAFITSWGAALVAIWAWGTRRLEAGGRQEAGRTRRSGDAGTRGQEGSTSNLKSQTSNLKPQTLKFLSPLLPAFTRILFGTALWCGLERLWSLGALNWTSLSYTQSPGNLLILHLGQLSGPLMLTAAIVAVNGLLAEAFIKWQVVGSGEGEDPGLRGAGAAEYFLIQNSRFEVRDSRFFPLTLLSTAAILLIALHIIGFGLFSRPLAQPDGTALRVGIIQGNVPTRIKLFSEGVRRAEKGYTQGYEKLADQGVEAVLTPEGALPYLWNQPNSLVSPFYQAVLRKQVVAWLGTFTAQKGGIARTLVTLTGDGKVFSFYNKIKLVPLGEYTPFKNVLGGIVGRLSPVSEDGVPGTFDQLIDTPFGRSIASICYDSAFPEVFRAQAAAGGQFILTASNLDPYSEVLMAQHQAQDLMRAIETDRWAVRATNTGYSGIIDPHGTIVWRSQPKTYEIHADTIYRRSTKTLYVRWGDWLTPLLLALTGAVWLFAQMRTRNLNQ
jgi:apolipoprotein N-acyltransferase